MNVHAHQRPSTSEYREFPVPASLADHFLCLWTQAIFGSPEYSHQVLPDGCVDIVFIDDEPPIVVGPWTSPFTATFASGTQITGARLSPGHAFGVLGIPASELLNRSVPLNVLWKRRKVALFDRVFEKQSLTARRLVLSEVLSYGIASAVPPDETVVASARWLAQHPHGQLKQLSRCIGISERQLHRRFSTAIGYGPKLFQSVLRFQRFLFWIAKVRRSHSLAHGAASAGYADQSHMTREVRRFAGDLPTALLQSSKCTLLFSDLLLAKQLF